MFKIGDRVRIIAMQERLSAIGIPEPDCDNLAGKEGIVTYSTDSQGLSIQVKIEGTRDWWYDDQDLELVETECCPPVPTGTIRTFDSGATRDTEQGKLDYEGFNNPIVEERYAEYLNGHRMQSDGKLRDSDNWQKLFGDNHFAVCMKSAFRHFVDVWKIHRGYTVFDRKTSEEISQEDAICGAIFNLKAYLLKLLQDKTNA